MKLRLPRPTRRVSLPATWRSLGRGDEVKRQWSEAAPSKIVKLSGVAPCDLAVYSGLHA
jgi:hypothetical protein